MQGLSSARLLLTSREGKPLNRNYINQRVWKPVLRAAGIADDNKNGMHAGRHCYASLQLEAGTSIRALAEYLGHDDPGFTLKTYTHLMPRAEDEARQAVDDASKRLEEVLSSASCGPGVAQEPV